MMRDYKLFFYTRAYLSLILVAVVLFLPTPLSALEKGFMYYGLDVKQLERRWGKDTERNAWSLLGDVGYDEWKIKLTSKGTFETRQAVYKRLEHQLLVYMPLSEFFDVKAGVRADSPDEPAYRNYAVLGLEGLTKQWLEITLSLFYNEYSGVSGLADFDYELNITQSIQLVPNFEIFYAEKDDLEAGIYGGWRKAELGMRLYYQTSWQKASPYIGYFSERALGKTADVKEAEGEPLTESFALVGISMSF